MILKYLRLILIASLLVLSACAEHTNDREVYFSKSGGRTIMDDFRIGLKIRETHHYDCSMHLLFYVFIDTYQESGFPYTLLVAARYSGETKDTTKILGLKMRIESEQEIDLLGKNQDKIEIPYDSARSSTIRLPLGSKLSF